MRLLSLALENFGVHASRRIDFGPGLQIVYGPNESGKTTLLAALRQSLFGIPANSDFGGETIGTRTQARVELASGNHITVIRQRSRGDGLSGEIEETHEPLTKDRWERALGGASQSLFENLFAFSLRELTSGEQSFVEAGLTEALYGMAVGGLKRFRQLAQSLDERADDLFTKRGRTKRTNQLLTTLQTLRKDYEQARFSGTDFTHLEEEIQERDAEAQRNRNLEDGVRRSLRELERMEAALPAWREAADTQVELAQAGPGASLPVDVTDKLRSLINRQRELQNEIQRQASRLLPNAPLLELPGSTLVPWTAVIRELADRVGQIRDALTEQHNLERQRDQLDQRITQSVNEIHENWSATDLPRVTASLAHGEVVRELELLTTQLAQTQTELQVRRTDLDEHRSRVELHLRELPDVDSLPLMRDQLDRAEEYRGDARRLADAWPAIESLKRQYDLLGSQLAGQIGVEPEALPEVVAPLSTTIDGYLTEWEVATRELTQAKQAQKSTEKQFLLAGEELATFDRDHPGEARDGLLALRRDREDGWELIVASRLKSQIATDDPAIVTWTNGQPDRLIDRYRDLVLQADLLSDRLLANAESTARRQQLVLRLEQVESQVAEACEATAAAQHGKAALTDRWHGEWKSPVTPRTPREMGEWIKEFTRWRQLHEQYEQQFQDWHQEREALTAFESELLRAFPQESLSGPPKHGMPPAVRAALVSLQARTAQLQQAAQNRERLLADQRELNVKSETLTRAEFAVSLEQGSLDQRRIELLVEMGLPGDWSVEVIARVIAFGKETLSLDRTRQEIALRFHRLQESIDSFRQQAESLYHGLEQQPEPVRLTCDRVLQWRSDLEKRLQLELEQQAQLAEQASAEQVASRFRDQVATVTQEIEQIQMQQGFDPAIDMAPLLREADRAEQLRIKLRELIPRWQAHADGDAAFEEKLRGMSLDQIHMDREQLTLRMRELGSARDRELILAETSRDRLKARSEDTRALALGQQLEFARSQLVEVVDQWAPLTLARHLMDVALKRFEKTQQPQLLQMAGQLFEQLTLGEYVQLIREVGDTNTLQVIPRRGGQKSPAELSTGTREQLYLAIRLAYLRQYAAKAEPLPLVMDDVLVNFDEDRAKQTLAVLSDFSREHQIIFLTCHRHMVDLARQVDGNLQPIELREGALSLGESVGDAGKSETLSRKSRTRSRKNEESGSPLLFREASSPEP